MPDADAKSNEETMLEEIKNVKTGQITYAVRDTKIDEKEIHEGDIMGIGDSGILSVGTEVEATALQSDRLHLHPEVSAEVQRREA